MIKRTVLALSLAATATSSYAGSYIDTTLNNSFATAASINPYFTTAFSPDIGNAAGDNTSMDGPWVTISGQGNEASDYFSFDIAQEGQQVTLDIDYTMTHPNNPYGFDAEVALWQQVDTNAYSLLDWNDDSSTSAGAGGSVHDFDSFQLLNAPAGRYIAGVSRFFNEPNDTGWSAESFIAGDRQYTLQVQVSPVPEPESYAMLLAGLGLIGAISRISRRRRMFGLCPG